ncbi:MAG: cupin domain-containing protein, partial [Streptomyces sp.]|nr:cupin domain-containing protein [Streptomyces sp.]
MPVVRSSEAVTHEMHGARFVSYATPQRGSKE